MQSTFSPTQEELLARLRWFVKLRWLFLLGVALVLAFAIKVFHLKIRLAPIVVIAVIVLIYNLLFYSLHKFLRDRSKEATAQGLRLEANLQIGLDLLALAFLVHYSGGIENPFIFFFVFHMIMGSILLSGWDIWLQAGIAIAILFTLLLLSYFNFIEHHHIDGFASDDLWRNVPYIFAGMVSFSATIFMSVYMTNSIARSLRKREDELFLTKNQLEKKSEELELANRELIRKQNLLIQTEKLASLGKLSAGVAHELNNPLTGILNFAYFIKDGHAQDEQLQNDIGVVIRETERCKRIIKGLLDFARQSQPEKKESDIAQLLNNTLSLVENHKDFKNITIIKDISSNLPHIMVDRDQIQQVFMNLIVNAQEAMELGGKLYVSARLAEKGDFIEIRFTDTGHGINGEDIRKIFDPFFTTKEKGTGLGLSISLGIIENHNGKLEVISSKGDGSTFIVKLPVS